MERIYLLIIMLAAAAFAFGCQNGAANRATGNASASVASITPTAAPQAGVKSLKIETPDKVDIVGTLYESPTPNSPGVLLLHQWDSDRHSYDDFAKRLQAKGFTVISIDGRGFGESTRTSDGGTIGPDRTDAAVKAMLGDVKAVVDVLSRQKNVDPARVAIVGASYGSSLALIYAAENPRVATVALLSPGINYFGNMKTEPAIKKYGDRPLFMTAAEDDKESADAVRQLQAAGGNKKYEIKLYPQGGHGTALFKVGLEGELEAFLTRTLGK